MIMKASDRRRTVEPQIIRDLPGEISHLLARATDLPERLRHAAGALEATLSELEKRGSIDDLRRIAAELRAAASYTDRQLVEVVALSGRLDALAWAADRA